MFSWIQTADWAVLHAIRGGLQCGFLDFLMPKVTLLASGGVIWFVLGIVLLCFKKYRTYGAALLLSLAVGLLVGNFALKPLVARPRPCQLETVTLLTKAPTGYSFPSTHTLMAAIAATVLCRADRRFAPFAVTLAVLIGFSRLYLYAHFPSDVLAAAVLGVAAALSCTALCQKIAEKRVQ